MERVTLRSLFKYVVYRASQSWCGANVIEKIKVKKKQRKAKKNRLEMEFIVF
jgi:hypothetical protein